MTAATAADTRAELCVRAQTELFGRGRVELADELVTPGCVDHTAPADIPAGPEGIKAVVGWLHRTFDDLRYRVDDVFGAGDRVALRCTVTGVHSGELGGRPPTGRRFETMQIHIYRLEGGRIAEHWGARNDLLMLMQLGLLGGEEDDHAE
jgi:predicted ester cyclase